LVALINASRTFCTHSGDNSANLSVKAVLVSVNQLALLPALHAFGQKRAEENDLIVETGITPMVAGYTVLIESART
jgi:hypothetical protein